MTSTTDEPDPQAAQQTRRSNFLACYDAESADRARRPIPDWRKAAQRKYLARLADERRRTVLEVGCGPGQDGRAIAAAGFEYTGADLSPGMVEVARTAGLDARVASATDLPPLSVRRGAHPQPWRLTAARCERLALPVPGSAGHYLVPAARHTLEP